MNNILIKDIPINDRPRERLINYGVKNISNEDLISIILKTGTKNKSVKDISNFVLKEFKDISNLKYLNINRLMKIEGIGKVKAIELIAAIELGRRVYLEKNINEIKIRDSNDIYKIFNNILKYKQQEHFYALYLDSKNKIIEKKLLFVGTINKSVAHPREIFKNAYLTSASFIICVHNHPSGDPTPSQSDYRATDRIYECADIMGIELLDHVVIGDGTFESILLERKREIR